MPQEDYLLAKWSRIVRIRDSFTCHLCEESPYTNKGLRKRDMHSHHIDPKYLYDTRKLDLTNGICLCARCHREIVHTSVKSWRNLRYIFTRYQKRKAVAAFNLKYQYKLEYPD